MASRRGRCGICLLATATNFMSKASAGRAAPAVICTAVPAAACQAEHRRLFDPVRLHAVLFDQRGAGRSRPRGECTANTLAHLIADLELIRAEFGFERWLVVGGSWGSTLALAYAEAHPARVTGLVLRATFLGTREELQTAFCNTLPQFYPALNHDFLTLLSAEERLAPLDAYWRRILDPDPAIHGPAAWALARYRAHAVGAHPGAHPARSQRATLIPRSATRLPLLEAHYFQNDCFLRPGQLLAEAGRLADIPGVIVQGRYDLLCPPATARTLTRAWRGAELRVIHAAGHSLFDTGVREAVVRAIDDLACGDQLAHWPDDAGERTTYC
ncbi:MAG: alpha/beta fold hydrolase [Rhodopseudomonas palustris]|nr:alpha/beta fold hydrolase [Rhodopseudomonas palustris]